MQIYILPPMQANAGDALAELHVYIVYHPGDGVSKHLTWYCVYYW